MDRFRFIFDSLGGSRNPELQEFRVLEDTEKVLQEIRWVFLLGAIGAVAELDFVQRLEIFQYLSVRGCTWPCVPGICKSFCRFPKGLGDVVIFG